MRAKSMMLNDSKRKDVKLLVLASALLLLGTLDALVFNLVIGSWDSENMFLGYIAHLYQQFSWLVLIIGIMPALVLFTVVTAPNAAGKIIRLFTATLIASVILLMHIALINELPALLQTSTSLFMLISVINALVVLCALGLTLVLGMSYWRLTSKVT